MVFDIMYVMGIDGGGSTVRAAIISPDKTIHAQVKGAAAVNPNVVGRDLAARTLHEIIAAALKEAQLSADSITAVGIGLAGAFTGSLRVWLTNVIEEALPGAAVRAGSDAEIALVGAHGERRGILVISGTGSIAYGVNAAGEDALVGGWGYLLDDEGGGYWLGIQALRAAIRALDGRGARTPLVQALLEKDYLRSRDQLIGWMYQSTPQTREIAGLAPLVLEFAEKGDFLAQNAVERGAQELALAVWTVEHRLKMENLPIGFAGGLLSSPNPLSDLLCARLGLQSFPTPQYAPVIGAAILAMLPG